MLTRKEAVRILELEPGESLDYSPREGDVKRVRGGLLVQDPDRVAEGRDSMTVPTAAEPSEEQWRDLLFAWKVCRHVRSNAIVFARDGATLGIGAGQMSRIDPSASRSTRHGTLRGEAADGFAGSAVASDAFYLPRRARGGDPRRRATALIQPGGSKRDDEVIAACDAAGAAMVFTGRRHFRH